MKSFQTLLLCTLAIGIDTRAKGERWALIVAGSRGWFNYRHQADVCHSFHVLQNHGIAEDHIVVMMFDDIANYTDNPFPGKIINQPHGEDVYAGVPRDYVGDDVTPENFLNVLQGKDMKGVGTGKSIRSGPNDHVFVYFADHGGTGIIAFPDDVLHVSDLNKALQKMHDKKHFSQLVFYMEACESGSMFKDVLPTNIDVYAMTASSYNESSWGCYCDNPENLPCLGDLFSVNWMQDSDVEELKTETLQHQFEVVKRLTNKSHVHEFGDLSITKEPVADFQGDTKGEMFERNIRTPISGLVNARDIPVFQLRRQSIVAPTVAKRRHARKELARLEQARLALDEIVMRLLASLIQRPLAMLFAMNVHPSHITDMHCHKNVVLSFHQHCFNLGQNGHAMSHVYKLANLCELNLLSTAEIVEGIINFCGAQKNKPNNVI